ncbi:MAG: conjugal transfer protein TraX [Lachnospiraceae bacterium]|nr:conjugal transfer protein TraX [Lachnospiraceae bacterium]
MYGLVTKFEAFVKDHGISNSTLKIIAYIGMFIDHGAAIILNPYILNNVGNMPYERFDALSKLYEIMRAVGRTAFPIFCFLIVEGFIHTKNVRKYALNLLLTAIVSEPVFDRAIREKWWDPTYQNVIFTLFLGLITIYLIDRFAYDEKYNVYLRMLNFAVIALAGMGLAYVLKTDYSYKGIIAIVLMYTFRRFRLVALMAGEAIFEYEPTAFFSIIPIMLYNNKRGIKLKYLFYFIYPVHLLVFWLISVKVIL